MMTILFLNKLFSKSTQMKNTTVNLLFDLMDFFGFTNNNEINNNYKNKP